MKSFVRKILCLLLSFIIFTGFVPIKASAIELESAEGVLDFLAPAGFGLLSVPEEMDSAAVAEKLEKLRKLTGTYFTVDGKPCVPPPGEWGHGCDNCKSSNLINAALLEIMPANITCLPGYYLSGGAISNPCWSCAAFASIAHWYLYAGTGTDAVRVNKIASGNFDADTLANAKPGDIVALSSVSTGRHYHSMIFIEHVPGGIKVIDSNWGAQTYGNCYVRERTMSYSSSYTVAVSRANNYIEDTVAVTGIEIIIAETGEYAEEISMAKGDSLRLSAEISPSDATNKDVEWTSSNDSVAKVSPEGVVSALGAGTAIITAKTADGGFEDSCSIEVTEEFYTVSYDANGGENAPGQQTFMKGEGIVLSAEEPSRAGFIFLGWAESAEAEEAEYVPEESCFFDGDTTLYAVWKIEIQNSEFILGDVNGDGKINIADANLARRYSAKLAVLDKNRQKAADVNGDGRVNIADANLIRRYSAKLIDSFPIEN